MVSFLHTYVGFSFILDASSDPSKDSKDIPRGSEFSRYAESISVSSTIWVTHVKGSFLIKDKEGMVKWGFWGKLSTRAGEAQAGDYIEMIQATIIVVDN